jgi:sporulation protein YunB
MRLGLGVRRRRKKFVFIFVIIFLILLICTVLKRLEPAYNSQISGYANSMANDVVNTAVNEAFSDEEYDSFVSVEKNSDNKITAVGADTAKINRLKSQLLLQIQENIKKCEAQTVYIPLFSASKFQILSGIGPKIPARIAPISIINSSLDEDFKDAGINQVKHRLTLKVSINVSCTGFMYSKKEITDIEIPISETIISGDIPDYYGGNIGVIGENKSE